MELIESLGCEYLNQKNVHSKDERIHPRKTSTRCLLREKGGQYPKDCQLREVVKKANGTV